MYNYFADSGNPLEDEKKAKERVVTGQHDCEALKAILDTFNLVRFVNVVKNTQHVKPEPDDDLPPIKRLEIFLQRWEITLEMAVDLLVGFAKENLPARKTILCMEFIKQIIDATGQDQEYAQLRKHIFHQVRTLMHLVVKP